MLILSRKKGEKIIIDNKIEIIVADIKNNEVRLGIKAPKDVQIFRSEIYEKILALNKDAAKSNISEIKKVKFNSK